MGSIGKGGAGDVARAQLLLGLLLLALLPITLLQIPPQTHGVTIELSFDEAAAHGGDPAAIRFAAAPPAAGVPTAYVALTLVPWPSAEGPRRRLELTPAGLLLLDGRAVDRAELRRRLDLLAAEGTDWIDFRPHPDARHEDFLETLAVAARADFYRFRLDNSGFRDAIGGGGAGKRFSGSRRRPGN